MSFARRTLLDLPVALPQVLDDGAADPALASSDGDRRIPPVSLRPYRSPIETVKRRSSPHIMEDVRTDRERSQGQSSASGIATGMIAEVSCRR